MSGERQVKVTVLGEDKGGSKALKDVESAATKIGPVTLDANKSLGQLTSTLTSRLGPAGPPIKSMLDGLGSSLKEMPPLAMAGAGAVLALGSVLVKMAADGIGKFESQTAEVRKLKAALGSTAEEASGMRNVAVGLGVDVDALSKGTAKLSVNLMKTGGDLAGVHVETARNADGTANLVKTWDNLRSAYQSIQDPQQKNIFLQQALAKGGIELRGVLSANNAEYDKMKARGPIYSDKDLQAGRDFAISQRELKASIDNVEVSLARGLVPVLTSYTQMLTGAVDWTQRHAESNHVFGAAVDVAKHGVLNMIPGLDALVSSHKTSSKATAEHQEQIEQAAAALKDYGIEVDDAEVQQGVLTKEQQAAVAQAEKYKQKIDDMGNSVSLAYVTMGGKAEGLSSKQRDLAKAMDGAKNSADQLKAGMDLLIGVHITATRAAIDWESKIQSTRAALDENGRTLDITTEKGRNNTAAILDMIQAAEGHIDAMGREGASSAEVTAAYQDHVAALRNVMRQAGFTEGQIDSLLGKYNLLAAAPDINKTISTNVNTYHNDYYGEYSQGQGGRNLAYALGLDMGPIPGTPGTPVPILAHAGEWVVTQSQLAALRRGGSSPASWSVSAGGSVHVAEGAIVVYALDPNSAAMGVRDKLVQYGRRVPDLGLSG